LRWVRASSTRYVCVMIMVVAALKGGVGKTTTAVYLAALAAASRRSVTLVDADPQASAADWIDNAEDQNFERVDLVEAPTERLLAKALAGIGRDDAAIVDTPPGHERLLAKALEGADVVVLPTRVGGVETPRVEAVLEMVPRKVPVGLVICSARTYTRDYQEAITGWAEAEVPLWGSVPERVSIATGPDSWLSVDGLDAYRGVWRRVLRAARES
jgi:chromosome partitioning protein